MTLKNRGVLTNFENKHKPLFSSLRSDWRTPKAFFESLNNEFHFDHDPCPTNPDINGIFTKDWGNSNFVNPPYGKAINGWIQKGVLEFQKGKIVVFLLPVRSDTAWFHDYILPFATEIRFIRHRLRFDDTDFPAPFPSMVVIFKP